MLSILVAVCFSMVCYNITVLRADVLERQWKWMYACGGLFVIDLAMFLVFY